MLREDWVRQFILATMETRCVIQKDRKEGKVKRAYTGLLLLWTQNKEALLFKSWSKFCSFKRRKEESEVCTETDLWSRWGLSSFLRGAVTDRVPINLSDMMLVDHG